jgi:hypothetical protein
VTVAVAVGLGVAGCSSGGGPAEVRQAGTYHGTVTGGHQGTFKLFIFSNGKVNGKVVLTDISTTFLITGTSSGDPTAPGGATLSANGNASGIHLHMDMTIVPGGAGEPKYVITGTWTTSDGQHGDCGGGWDGPPPSSGGFPT